MMTNINISL